MTNGHLNPESNGSRQPTHRAGVSGYHTNTNRDSQLTPYGGSQVPPRDHKIPPISQTRRRPVKNVVGTDTGLGDFEINVCYSAGYSAKWVSGASIAANEREMASDLSRREASIVRTVLRLQTNGPTNRRGAAVFHSGDGWWEQLQSHN